MFLFLSLVGKAKNDTIVIATIARRSLRQSLSHMYIRITRLFKSIKIHCVESIEVQKEKDRWIKHHFESVRSNLGNYFQLEIRELFLAFILSAD